MNIEITENAAKHGRLLLEGLAQEDPTVVGVYVGITGGGCAGFQYIVTPMLEKDLGDDYLLFEKDCFKVYTDYTSLAYLDGALIDWQTGADGSRMLIRNPNSTTTCGCGTSFS